MYSRSIHNGDEKIDYPKSYTYPPYIVVLLVFCFFLFVVVIFFLQILTCFLCLDFNVCIPGFCAYF